MKTPRNKGRAPGQTVLGVPMTEDLKGRIKRAAEIDERTMADWARIALREAAKAVISAHNPKDEKPEVKLQALPSASPSVRRKAKGS